jgi:predicted RNA polymerase sigma factor
MICGLTTEEIARAFLVGETAVARRIVRAKRTLSESGLGYATPRGAALSERLASVLEIVYLIFNEGYTATRGEEWLRPQLCEEALRMGRVLASIAPLEPEAHASRTVARVEAAGHPILLMDQDRALWDRAQIRRGITALVRAQEFGGAAGFYTLQAAIVYCHALAPSPIIELNRAVAVGMADGPAAGLARLDRLALEPALKAYHLLPCCAAICCNGWVVAGRPTPRSRKLPRWPATGVSRS